MHYRPLAAGLLVAGLAFTGLIPAKGRTGCPRGT